MKLPAHHRDDSLRFLLYLEWILLGIVALSEILPRSPFSQLPRSPLLNLIGLGVFVLMGLKLPSRPTAKVFYTVVEMGLLLFLTTFGGIRLFTLLYVVLIVRNCLVFEGYYRSVVATIAVGLCISLQAQRFRSLELFRIPIFVDRGGFLLLSFIVMFGLIVIFLQALVNAALSERRSREQLAIANTRLRQYALRIEDQATLQERNRIARDIHDSLGHSLTAYNLHLEAALRLLQSDPEEAKALLVEAKQIGSTALQEVRQSVSALRSDPLQGRSLEAAIATLIEEFRRSTGITPNCQLLLHKPLSGDIQSTVYRIVQEALTNICKYAAATAVDVTIQTIVDRLQVSVQDNGQGFDPNQTTTGFGLQGMQERTAAIAGQFELIAAPQQGCQIRATFPLQPPS
ncbi:sensor histidine kinase [Stenomitos frigidus]|uniref:histidine kinase n=1 Tax=Stenomitos frigidus ULC18 TaxID=2107698 RepID=A0A2T1DT62_9CYAN|nr:sensor histidine kinase [Stenomitos frigidus]PSB23601.1 sensor histidine kinase [Stenomitos frigidus ULC18]